jgi:hypothetical protein
MTATDARPEPRRDRWGRYLIVPPEGGAPVSYQRVTTLARILEDGFGLQLWAQRMTARGLAMRGDLLARVAATEDKAQLDKLVEQAKEAAAASSGANLGTALHEFTEQVDRGKKIIPLPPLDADVRVYSAALAEAGLVPEHIERIVVHDQDRVAGTFDRIFRRRDGSLVLGDLKTAQSLDYSWGSIDIQLALYAGADALYDFAVDPADDSREPMPAVDHDHGVVVHLPAGKGVCSLWDVDLTMGFEGVALALGVRDWRKRDGFAVPLRTPVRRDDLVAAIRGLTPAQRAVLARLWPPGVPTLRAATDHRPAQLDAINLAVDTAKKETAA